MGLQTLRMELVDPNNPIVAAWHTFREDSTTFQNLWKLSTIDANSTMLTVFLAGYNAGKEVTTDGR